LGLAALIYPLTGTNPLIPPDRSNQVATLIYAGVLLADAVIRSAWVPIVWIVQLMAYLDLRVRREAYDLELLTAAVEARAAARQASQPPGGSPEAATGRPGDAAALLFILGLLLPLAGGVRAGPAAAPISLAEYRASLRDARTAVATRRMEPAGVGAE